MPSGMRAVIPVFMLFMWYSLYRLFQDAVLPVSYAVVAGYVMTVCLIAFRNFVKVFTYGYALSMLGGPLLIAVLYDIPPAGLTFGALVALYGVRLVYFQYTRERAASYAGHIKDQDAAHHRMPLPVKGMIYLFTGPLLLHYATIMFLTRDTASFRTSTVLGAALMALGLLLETLADAQKQKAKAESDRFVSTGLYARLRHPNYLGEVVFHAGALVYAVPQVSGWLVIAACAVAPVYLILLMLVSAHGLDGRMREHHGDTPGFDQYYDRSWSILPGVM